MKVIKRDKRKSWVNVGELLMFLQDNKVPASAEIIIECVDEVYPLQYGWDHVNAGTFHKNVGDEIYCPIGNGMTVWKNGKKKYLAIHNHW